MTANQTIIAPSNVITKQGRIALTALATHLRADLEISANEETGDEVASLVRIGATVDDDFDIHFMPDPYAPHGYGWVAVSGGEAIVAAPSLAATVKQYRDAQRER